MTFETFNHRMSEKVGELDFFKKFKIHGIEPFTKRDLDFFQKLKKENGNSDCVIDLGTTGTIFIQLNRLEYDGWALIEITKLGDDWYLINGLSNNLFICDEFDEILGYLERKTDLSF